MASRLEKIAASIKMQISHEDQNSLYRQERFLTEFEKELIRSAFMVGIYCQQNLDIEQEKIDSKG